MSAYDELKKQKNALLEDLEKIKNDKQLLEEETKNLREKNLDLTRYCDSKVRLKRKFCLNYLETVVIFEN